MENIYVVIKNENEILYISENLKNVKVLCVNEWLSEYNKNASENMYSVQLRKILADYNDSIVNHLYDYFGRYQQEIWKSTFNLRIHHHCKNVSNFSERIINFELRHSILTKLNQEKIDSVL